MSLRFPVACRTKFLRSLLNISTTASYSKLRFYSGNAVVLVLSSACPLRPSIFYVDSRAPDLKCKPSFPTFQMKTVIFNPDLISQPHSSLFVHLAKSPSRFQNTTFFLLIPRFCPHCVLSLQFPSYLYHWSSIKITAHQTRPKCPSQPFTTVGILHLCCHYFHSVCLSQHKKSSVRTRTFPFYHCINSAEHMPAT